MKRKACLCLIGILLCGLLAACGHEHIWQEATCETPGICKECGETAGEPLGHDWHEATCTEPKTCSVCGATEGTATGHSWADATCAAPRTCSICGVTEGTALEHNWLDATCTVPKTCGICGATEGAAPGHSYGAWSEPEQDPQGNWIRSSRCAVCGEARTEAVQIPAGRTDLGSAGELEGTTLLVSIFANDALTEWDFQSERDKDVLEIMDLHLEAGVDWLVQQVGAYGVDSQFIYKWEDNPQLCYTFDFDRQTLVRADGGGYQTQADYVEAHIPTQALKEKYRAQNVIYIFFFNTDEENTVNSWSLSDRSGADTEIINVFVRDDYFGSFYYMPAASFAHEIMHCFGAHDLYYPSETIPQAYVDHCAASGSNDIMYTVGLGENITQTFTELDAYYMGLVDSCDEVDIWGLGKSSHGE